MNEPAAPSKSDRPALPRDAFRTQRSALTHPSNATIQPVVVTPSYDDSPVATALQTSEPQRRPAEGARPQVRSKPARKTGNPFDGYGERSSSRPYALRFPDPIDLVLRQMAAEERTHPLRVIDRIVYEHLKRAGRLPPVVDLSPR